MVFLFLYGCDGASLVCVGFPRCSEQGLLFIAMHGLLIVLLSPFCRAQALGTWNSVVQFSCLVGA